MKLNQTAQKSFADMFRNGFLPDAIYIRTATEQERKLNQSSITWGRSENGPLLVVEFGHGEGVTVPYLDSDNETDVIAKFFFYPSDFECITNQFFLMMHKETSDLKASNASLVRVGHVLVRAGNKAVKTAARRKAASTKTKTSTRTRR